jgi:hypothetical protein
MPRLVAPLSDFLRGVEDAVHRARRAEIRVLLQQRGLDFRGGLIDESLAVQDVEYGLSFGEPERAREAARTVGVDARAGRRRR